MLKSEPDYLKLGNHGDKLSLAGVFRKKAVCVGEEGVAEGGPADTTERLIGTSSRKLIDSGSGEPTEHALILANGLELHPGKVGSVRGICEATTSSGVYLVSHCWQRRVPHIDRGLTRVPGCL